VDNDMLAEITAKSGGPASLVEEVENANTARHAYELWRSASLEKAADLLCQQAADNLAEYTEGKLEVHVIMVDFDTLDPAGASPGALELTAWRPA
jgi:cobalt-precorrin-5B (C1)-methyltransferase